MQGHSSYSAICNFHCHINTRPVLIIYFIRSRLRLDLRFFTSPGRAKGHLSRAAFARNAAATAARTRSCARTLQAATAVSVSIATSISIAISVATSNAITVSTTSYVSIAFTIAIASASSAASVSGAGIVRITAAAAATAAVAGSMTPARLNIPIQSKHILYHKLYVHINTNAHHGKRPPAKGQSRNEAGT
jgi:hypothetical protein